MPPPFFYGSSYFEHSTGKIHRKNKRVLFKSKICSILNECCSHSKTRKYAHFYSGDNEKLSLLDCFVCSQERSHPNSSEFRFSYKFELVFREFGMKCIDALLCSWIPPMNSDIESDFPIKILEILGVCKYWILKKNEQHLTGFWGFQHISATLANFSSQTCCNLECNFFSRY